MATIIARAPCFPTSTKIKTKKTKPQPKLLQRRHPHLKLRSNESASKKARKKRPYERPRRQTGKRRKLPSAPLNWLRMNARKPRLVRNKKSRCRKRSRTANKPKQPPRKRSSLASWRMRRGGQPESRASAPKENWKLCARNSTRPRHKTK